MLVSAVSLDEGSYLTNLTDFCFFYRIRRIKCDEGRPQCNRCASTGRICDGYQSLFRFVVVGAFPAANKANAALDPAPLPFLHQPSPTTLNVNEVAKLAQYFHRRRQNKVCYEPEARAILSSRFDPAVRHALDSLIALHDELEQNRHATFIAMACRGRYIIKPPERSLFAYNTAVSILASRLRDQPSQATARTALLCCQLFISIETLMGDYRTAFRQLLMGLRILYQDAEQRSGGDSRGRTVSWCRSSSLPRLDAFSIKLFASGYPGPKNLSAAGDGAESDPVQVESRDMHPLDVVDQARNELRALSTQVLTFLDRVANPGSLAQLVELETEKARLLRCLRSWAESYHRTITDTMEALLETKVRAGTLFPLLLHRILCATVSRSLRVDPAEISTLERDFGVVEEMAALATEARRAAIEKACENPVETVTTSR